MSLMIFTISVESMVCCVVVEILISFPLVVVVSNPCRPFDCPALFFSGNQPM